VTGFLAGEERISHHAKLRFNRGQLELPLALCHACMDRHCDAGTTCKRGECVDASVGSVGDLPKDDGRLVDSIAECGP